MKIPQFITGLFPPASCILLLVSVITAHAVEEETNKVEDYLNSLDTFSATFEQELVDASGEVLETSVGVVYIKRPGKFHWNYYEPYSQYLISNGRTLWVYDEDLEQVTIRDMTDSMEDTPAAILGGEVDLDRHFVVIDVDDQGETDWFELTPRDIESQFQSLRLGFQGDRLTGMVLNDSLDQQTRISFLDSRRNPSLEDQLFVFQPPDGVDVIDSRQRGQ